MLMALVPFAYFWSGKEPDLVTDFIYCNMAYHIEEKYFLAMIVFLWVATMNYFWQHFAGEVRRRLIIAGTIQVCLQYLLGRTYYDTHLHIPVLITLLLNTIGIFILSRKWNWELILAFVTPGVFAFALIMAYGGSNTDKDVDRRILWVYAISTHWPVFVFTFWLFIAPSMKDRTARFDRVDHLFEFKK